MRSVNVFRAPSKKMDAEERAADDEEQQEWLSSSHDARHSATVVFPWLILCGSADLRGVFGEQKVTHHLNCAAELESLSSVAPSSVEFKSVTIRYRAGDALEQRKLFEERRRAVCWGWNADIDAGGEWVPGGVQGEKWAGSGELRSWQIEVGVGGAVLLHEAWGNDVASCLW